MHRGLTLVELLVAMTIGSLLIVSVVSTTVTITRTRNRVDERVSRSGEARLALAAVVAQLRNVRRDWTRDRPPVVGSTTPRWGGGSGNDRIDLLVISDRPARPDAPESDQFEVSFYLTRRQGVPWPTLVMRKDHELDEFPGEGGLETVVAEGITALTFEYFNGEDWLREWSELEPLGPKAVRVTVVATDRAMPEPGQTPRHVTLSTVAPIRLSQPSRRPQTGNTQPPQPQPSGGRR
jgi:prepilin-type N-terminal cleavage/methylation domain-containing protein